MTPEQRARQQIDLLLQQCGWIIQNRSETNLSAGPGVAIREALLKTGEADYLLFAGGKAIATVEASFGLPSTENGSHWVVPENHERTRCADNLLFVRAAHG